MVRSVKNDPRIKRVGGASDETAALVSRVQVLKVRSTGGTTSSFVRFKCKEANDFKPNVCIGERTSRSLL